MRQERQSEKAGQDDHEPEEMDARSGIHARHGDLEESEDGVEDVLWGVGPDREGGVERQVAGEHGPEDYGHQERVGGDGGVVEVVEGLEGAGEAVEERSVAVQCVGESVDCCDGEIEGQSPVGEDYALVRKCVFQREERGSKE